MRDYFALQFRLVNRHLSDFGIQPALGYLLMAIIFSGFTAYLFYVSSFASYVYALLALGFSSLLSEAGRTGFLKQHFSQKQYLIIRCIENITVVLPFIIGLLIYHEWLLALDLLFISAALSYTSIERNLNIVVPTQPGLVCSSIGIAGMPDVLHAI
jgi:Kef-type K+ transport system membrane component KefB